MPPHSADNYINDRANDSIYEQDTSPSPSSKYSCQTAEIPGVLMQTLLHADIVREAPSISLKDNSQPLTLQRLALKFLRPYESRPFVHYKSYRKVV